MPEYAPYLAPNPLLIPAQMIPIGFSIDGLFAYVIEPADEACGCYFFELHIQDLKDDRHVYVKRVEVQGTSTPAWERVWARHGVELSAKLHAHRIVPQPWQQSPLPIMVDTVALSLRVAAQHRPSEFRADERFVNEASLWLGNRQWGEKRIARLRYPDDYVYALQPACYLKSPFEDRVAIVLTRKDRGWEGPPHTIHFEVVGAHLRTRFPLVDSLAPR